MMAAAVPEDLNSEIELAVQANACLSTLFPRAGTLMLGNAGVEFRGRGGAGFVQVPWDALSVVRVDVYGSFVRSVELHVADGRSLSFVVSDGAEVVRCMSRHLDRSQLVPATKPLSHLIGKLRYRR